MCYYNSLTDVQELSKDLKVKNSLEFPPHPVIDGFKYEPHPVIVKGNSGLEFRMMNWGFLPREVKSKLSAKTFRRVYTSLVAKCEKYASSRFYKEAFSQRHCIIPSTGFFEKRYYRPKGKIDDQLYPYYISPVKANYFLIAGIYQESHFLDSGDKQHTLALVTRSANKTMQQIHNNPKNPNRMPLILSRQLAKSWLNNDESENREILDFIYPSAEMKAWPVTKKFTVSESPTLEHSYRDLPPLDI